MFSKKDWKYIALLAGAIIALILSEVFAPKPIDWTKTFKKSDKNPYGNYILFNQLEDIFEDDDIKVNRITAYEAEIEGEEWQGYNSIIYINEQFQPDELEMNALCKWVAGGNYAFIAASANIEELDPEAEGLPIATERRDGVELTRVMSNSFGFGGTNASLVFQKFAG